MVTAILLYIITSIVTGIGEALRIKDVNKYSPEWHALQFFERLLFFVSGAWTFTYFPFWDAVAMLFLLGIIFFILYDGIINLYLGRQFFYVSKTTKAQTEKFAHWYIKIPMLVLIIITNIVLRRNKDV